MASELILTPQVASEGVVETEGKQYDLSAPTFDAASAIVKRAQDDLLKGLNLKEVTQNLENSIQLYNLAFLGTAGTNVQDEIITTQSGLAMLCNECIISMITFENESKEIIENIADTYKWLIRGKETLALKKLNRCSESAQKMADTSGELGDKFAQFQQQTTSILSSTIELETNESTMQAEQERLIRDLAAKQEAAQTHKTELASKIKQLDTLYNSAKEREESAAKKALWMGIASAVAGAVGAGVGAAVSMRKPAPNMAPPPQQQANPQQQQLQADQEKAKQEDLVNQKALAAAKEKQTFIESQISQLEAEIKALNDKKATAPLTADEEVSLKTKEQELATAKTQLTSAQGEVKAADSKASISKQQYAAAASAAFNSISQSTGQMAQSAADAQQSIYQEKMAFLNKKFEAEDQQMKLAVELTLFAKQLENAEIEEGNAKLAVQALHIAVMALGKCVAALTDANLFWRQMATYCASMANPDMLKDVEDYMEVLTPEERIAEYTDLSFMVSFLEYSLKWFVVNYISKEYQVQAQNAQKQATDFLKNIPSIEEAKLLAPKVAQKMAIEETENLRRLKESRAETEQQKVLVEAENEAVKQAAA